MNRYVTLLTLLVLLSVGAGTLYARATPQNHDASAASAATLSTPGSPGPGPTFTLTPSSTPLPTARPSATPKPTASHPGPPKWAAGYWHTAGTAIVTSTGKRVRIAGVTWYGMETSYWVPAGLDHQPYQSIMSRVKRLGYNTIRLPISDELVESNPKVTQHVARNHGLKGMHALQVLDRIVDFARHLGLKIILDDHVSRAQRPNAVNSLSEPLWYTKQYPESHWINDWKTLARRYRGNSAVIGFDLRNEPHTHGPGPWSLQTYLRQGATWGPYKGVDNPKTDWRLAAQRAGNAVLSVNPYLLIFVEGLQLYPDPTQTRGVLTGWWGWNFSMVRKYPVVLKVPHHLVYSPHDWGPVKSKAWWFAHNSYQLQKKVWHSVWSYLLDNPKAPYAAPIFIGEFGTCTNFAFCVDGIKPGDQAMWFHFFLRFMKEHPNVGWDFWALNGSNANDHAANNGLLNHKWNGLANVKLQKDLASIQK